MFKNQITIIKCSFILICITFIIYDTNCELEHGSELGFKNTTSTTIEQKRLCGHFNVSHNSSFDIFDRENHNEGFATILRTDEVHEKIYSVNIESGCELIFCVINMFAGKKRSCKTFRNFVNLNSDEFTYSVTTSCSCKEPLPNCSQTFCSNVELNENTCAQFYKESNCSECRYEPFKLPSNYTINPTNNSFIVNSLIIKQNCSLEIKTYGTASANSAAVQYYDEGSYDSIQLSYFQKYKPAEFTCICGELRRKLIASTPSSETQNTIEDILPNKRKIPTLSPIIIGIISSILILLLIGSVTIGYKYFKARNKLLKYSKDAIKKFKDGSDSEITMFPEVQGEFIVSFQDDGNINSSSANKCHYISLGYLEALRKPYYSKYEISRDNLIIHENMILGEGNFGKVCSGQLFKPNNVTVDVAVKTSKGSRNIIYFVSLLDEIKILSYLDKHPNIVCILGACTKNIHQRDALLLLEPCKNGSLKSYLRTNHSLFTTPISNSNSKPSTKLSSGNKIYRSWDSLMIPVRIKDESFIQLIKWSEEIANGMDFLGSRKVVHIDLAARNILLSDDLTAKISDFGLSRRIQSIGNYAKLGDDYGLPISWMALESLKDKRFTIESDIWAFGVLLWEIFSFGNEPYEEMKMDVIELLNYLDQNKRLKKPQHASNEIFEQMLKCWSTMPSERPTFSELKEFFETYKYDCDKHMVTKPNSN